MSLQDTPPPQWGQQQPQWDQQQWQNAPQPGYGWPPPPAPRRRRFGIKRVVLIVIVAIAGSGVYAYAHSKGSDVATVSAVTCNPATLTSCLIAKPSSASHYVDSWGASSTPTKAEYLKWAYDLDPISQQIASDNLTSAGLQSIAHTAWKGADGNGIDLTLLKFSGPQGAHSRALELLGSEILAGDPVAVPDGIPGSAYSGRTANTNGDIDTQYSVNVDDMVLQVHYYSSGSYSPTDFSAWLSAEYKSLSTAPKVAPSPQPVSTTQSVTCSSSLRSCLLAAPSGSTGWGNSWGDSTTPSASQYAAQMFTDSGWRTIIAARLKAVGLTGIAHRAWVTSNGAEADDIVLSFSTANGAMAWYKNDAYSNTGTAFTVPGQQNVSGTYDPKPNSDGNVSAEVFGVSGTTVMELFTWSPQSFDKTRTVTWASQQLTRIGSTSKTQTVAVTPIPTPTANSSGASGSTSSCSAAQGCLMAPPSGSAPWSDTDYDKSTTATVQQYVQENYSSDSGTEQTYEENLLNDAGVKAIAHREWNAADGSGAMVTVLQYGSATQAHSEALDYEGAILATGSELTVPGLKDAVVDIKPLDASGDVPIKIDLWKGSYEVRLSFYNPATADPQGAVSVALQQLADLPGN